WRSDAAISVRTGSSAGVCATGAGGAASARGWKAVCAGVTTGAFDLRLEPQAAMNGTNANTNRTWRCQRFPSIRALRDTDRQAVFCHRSHRKSPPLRGLRVLQTRGGLGRPRTMVEAV